MEKLPSCGERLLDPSEVAVVAKMAGVPKLPIHLLEEDEELVEKYAVCVEKLTRHAPSNISYIFPHDDALAMYWDSFAMFSCDMPGLERRIHDLEDDDDDGLWRPRPLDNDLTKEDWMVFGSRGRETS